MDVRNRGRLKLGKGFLALLRAHIQDSGVGVGDAAWFPGPPKPPFTDIRRRCPPSKSRPRQWPGR